MWYLPAEWETQNAVLLIWPQPDNTFTPSYRAVEIVYEQLVAAISRFETVFIVYPDEITAKRVEKWKKNLIGTRFPIYSKVAKTNDIWMRDCGPITVLDENSEPLLLDFQFNAWGNKYNAKADNELTRNLYAQKTFSAKLKTIDLVLEGGSIEVDGIGTLLTTRACLLNPNRNPQFSETDISEFLKNYLGCKRILWLDHGYLAGDDTDSHIDMLARFCNPHTICYAFCEDKNDEHYKESQALQRELESLRTLQDTPYELYALPWPKPIYNATGLRLPASYANFLIINDAVILPVYDDAADELAVAILKQCFPTRKIIPVESKALIYQYGSIHCITMQLPKGVAVWND